MKKKPPTRRASAGLSQLPVALRACGHHLRGLRREIHRKTMQVLMEWGLVEERAPYLTRDVRWFPTPAGKELLVEFGMGEPWEG